MAMPAMTDLLQEALALHRRGAIADAAARYAEVLRTDPGNADAHYYLGMIDCQHARFAEGAERARSALANDPRHPRAHVLLGRALSALRRHDEALLSFEQAIALAPDLAQAHGHRADVLSELGRNAEAVDSYDRALALAPECVEDCFNRGVALIAVGRHGEAIGSFDRAIAGKPDFAQAHLWRAKVLSGLGRYAEALGAIDKAAAIAPSVGEAWFGRGNILAELGRNGEAIEAYDRALALAPQSIEGWFNRGLALIAVGRHDEATASFDRVIDYKPDFAQARLLRAKVLLNVGRTGDALEGVDTVLQREPNLAEAWLGRANVLSELKRGEEAFAACERAIALKPDLAEAWLGRGNLFAGIKRHDEAFAAYDRAVALSPELGGAASHRLHAKLHMCDWTGLDTEVAKVLSGVKEQKLSNDPFAFLAISPSAADQLACARRYVQEQPAFSPLWRGEVYAHDRIRIAYLSADFGEHPVAYLAAGLFEQHDKSRFEVTGISFGPDPNSPTRNRIKGAFERFEDVRGKSDQAIAELIRRLEIDIAVDLMGLTEENRLNVLARRAAPIQVNYLGYPGTTGAGYIDYILADPTIIPEHQKASYAEQVVWLPDAYQINDNSRRISEHTPARRECGLPETAFVFCCFNNNYKITPEIFDIWMRLLRATENSVLWLLEANAAAAANLRREAEKRGVSSQRLVFAPKISVADHLARQRQADLFLDTLPYNAHTTASDALWAGLPLLTCAGSTFAGRVAGSLLKAAGLPELVTTSLADYEALAFRLAHDRPLLDSLKAKLKRNRESCSLFDTRRSTRHIEAAYIRMWQTYRQGRPPASFAASVDD
jgi:protein O-GlcNAc transferase